MGAGNETTLLNMQILTNNRLNISLSPKTGTSNLVHFFIGSGGDGVTGDSKYSDIFSMTEFNWTYDSTAPLIVITRNETDRWCSGVVQELDRLYKDYQFSFQHSELKQIKYMLEKEVETSGTQSIFTNPDGHSRLIPKWISLLPILTRLNNVYFTDISSLSSLKFWNKIYKMDDSWPDPIDWYDDWIDLKNKNLDYTKVDRGVTVGLVRNMLIDDNRLNFILKILDNSQEVIDWIKTTNKWLKF